ncbi:ATP-binding protein [Piscibacillus salipiscarius]|uniref:ATP-binding protein n=1 Tax=Piscibacillus salipiscarius TaxID=299480 RepID=A0ABW5Q712_9BACI|nr:ATP-binding protein [Piscibacillus salipiscarius]
MQQAKAFLSSIKRAGEEICESCGNVYPVYETPRGILGACKPCEDRKLKESLNLPSKDELDSIKAKNFIERFTVVPEHLQHATINSYQAITPSQITLKEWVVDLIRNFEVRPSDSLVVSGKAGLGKSHVAYATVKALKSRGYKVLYFEVSKLLDYFRKVYDNHAKYSKDDLYNMIEKLDLLVLDDIGSEYIKGNENGQETWASEVLFNVLNLRQGKRKIVTTNYTERQLQQKYGIHGERITSRMFDHATSIRLEGQDYRKKGDA